MKPSWRPARSTKIESTNAMMDIASGSRADHLILIVCLLACWDSAMYGCQGVDVLKDVDNLCARRLNLTPSPITSPICWRRGNSLAQVNVHMFFKGNKSCSKSSDTVILKWSETCFNIYGITAKRIVCPFALLKNDLLRKIFAKRCLRHHSNKELSDTPGIYESQGRTSTYFITYH